MGSNNIIIDIIKLDLGKIKNYSFEQEFKKKEIPFKIKNIEFADSLFLKFTVAKHSDIYLITGKFKTKLNLICDKCGEKYLSDFNNNFEIVLTRTLENENEPDDMVHIGNEPKIDITENIREEIAVNIPMISKCSDNCKGLCPVCGINLNKKECDCDKTPEKNMFSGIDLDDLEIK
jgi:uncharacterized protein